MKGKKLFLFIMTVFCMLCILSGISMGKPADDDEDNDDTPPAGSPKAPFRSYLPENPAVKKMHLEAMALALENAAIIKERSAQQVEKAALEMEESSLKYELLKNRIYYYRLREKASVFAERGNHLSKLLTEQDKIIDKIDKLTEQEEKIDCYHTIFERKHKATEEYQWSLIDDKHSLISEYLEGMDYSKNKAQFDTLYGEMITDYREIIRQNRLMLEESKTIIEAKKIRQTLMKEGVERMKGLVVQLESALNKK